MPQQLDFLLERLKHFDEVTLLELLDISSEDILHKFRSKIVKRREYLCRELELINIEDEEIDEDELEVDGIEGFTYDKGYLDYIREYDDNDE